MAIGNGQHRTVVGVVGDVRQLDPAQEPTPTMYFSPTWYLWTTMTLTVRTDGDPVALIAPIRAIAQEISPQAPLYDLQPLATVVDASVAGPRLQTTVLAIFAALGLLLAALGVAGVMAFLVTRRTPELAVRLALGATPGRVQAQVLRGGGLLCAMGVGFGLVLSVALSRLLDGVLTGPATNRFATIAVTVGVLLLVGLTASWWPARRATRIAPSLALRGD